MTRPPSGPDRSPPDRPPRDPGLATERTALSWLRTGLAITVAALFVGRVAVTGVGLGAVLPTLLAVGAGLWVAFASLRERSSHRRDRPTLHDGALPALVTGALVLVSLVEIVSAIVT
ncbi:DUF202 domain-containing protein [Intrasporangium calvum]|uniref:DUF202 domain-containing protein n=1 Tax=Intrasporangium calvum TaxID=53358 RepID=A0ABT5GDG8_9MICO|nr:DUF202 domain-containing protein [Intrasporangium calvum]MDC5696259.1 DUF202 domain-containing protein [Intrasporangium calvum]